MVKGMAKAVRWGVMGFGAPMSLEDVGRSEEGAAWRFAGYQGRGWDGVTDGDGWNGGARYQGLVGLARVGVELSGNIISNYRTFKCERSERTYNFDYVRRKRIG